MDTAITGFSKGDFIMLDGLHAVVVGTDQNENIPKDHVAIFLGAEGNKRESKRGVANPPPVVLVVPIDLCEDGVTPVYKVPSDAVRDDMA